MESILTCISCPKGCQVHVNHEGTDVLEVRGNRCSHGADYAFSEVRDPRRVLTSTVVVRGGRLPLVPVRTRSAIPKSLLLEAMTIIKQTTVPAPVSRGDVIVSNVLDTGVDIIACRGVAPFPETS